MDWFPLLVLFVVAAVALGTFNLVVRLYNAVRMAAAQIEVTLKRRFDLVPNLVQAVQGQMDFERATLTAITAARSGVAAAGEGIGPTRLAAENQLTNALAAFRIQVEAYPELRSNENVLHLQEELVSSENQIGFARQAYNTAVLQYRSAVETVPTAIVARLTGFRADAFAFYDAGPEAAEAPPVNLR